MFVSVVTEVIRERRRKTGLCDTERGRRWETFRLLADVHVKVSCGSILARKLAVHLCLGISSLFYLLECIAGGVARFVRGCFSPCLLDYLFARS